MTAWLPRLQILAAALLFSTGGMGVKSCGLPEAQIASFRCGIAAVVLILLLPWLRQKPQGTAARPAEGWSWRPLLVGCFFAATMICFVLANKSTTASNAIFLQSTAPLYIFFLGPLLLAERNRRGDMWAMLALGAGMILLLSGDVETSTVASNPWRGNLLAALAGLGWAATLMGLRYFSDDTADEKRRSSGGDGAIRAVISGNVVGFLVVLPWALPIVTRPLGDWLWLFYLGIFQIGLAYVFLTRGLRRVSALDAALLLLIEPLLNPVWAFLVHAELPHGRALLGAVIILLVTMVRPLLDRRLQMGQLRA